MLEDLETCRGAHTQPETVQLAFRWMDRFPGSCRPPRLWSSADQRFFLLEWTHCHLQPSCTSPPPDFGYGQICSLSVRNRDKTNPAHFAVSLREQILIFRWRTSLAGLGFIWPDSASLPPFDHPIPVLSTPQRHGLSSPFLKLLSCIYLCSLCLECSATSWSHGCRLFVLVSSSERLSSLSQMFIVFIALRSLDPILKMFYIHIYYFFYSLSRYSNRYSASYTIYSQ